MFSFIDVVEASLLVIALSLDAFFACFSYGVNRIEIPFKSLNVINLICTGILAAALYIGVAVRSIIPQGVAAGLCFAILMMMGLIKLFDSAIKQIIRKRKIETNLRFKLSSLRFILHVYADPEEADMDVSRVLNPSEAAYLAVALSLDGVGAGFGAGLASGHPVLVIFLSLVLGYAAVLFGGWLGKKLADKVKLDLSWLGGTILVVLAIAKILA